MGYILIRSTKIFKERERERERDRQRHLDTFPYVSYIMHFFKLKFQRKKLFAHGHITMIKIQNKEIHTYYTVNAYAYF